MSKNKRGNGGGFDKFGPKNPPSSSGPVTTVEVEDDDEADGAEPTDTVPTEEIPIVGREAPAGAYSKLDEELMKATTVMEQEVIIAKHTNKPCDIPDMAAHYKAALVKGRSLPPYTPKSGTDPLLVRAKDLIERILAGGLLPPTSYGVYNLGVDLCSDIIKQTSQETADVPEEAKTTDAGSSTQ